MGKHKKRNKSASSDSEEQIDIKYVMRRLKQLEKDAKRQENS